MLRNIKIFSLLALSLMLTGCLIPTVKNVTKEFKLEGSKNGVAFISLTQDNNYSIFHTYIYKNQSGNLEYYGDLESRVRGAFLPLFEDEEFPWPKTEQPNAYMGRVLALDLEPGEYVIRKWEVKFGQNLSINPVKFPKKLKFIVNAGEVYYLGNIHMRVSESNEVRPVIQDSYERDLAVFRKKYPNLSSDKVIKQIGYTGPWLPLAKVENK